MATLGNTGRVGAAVVIGLALFVAMWMFFNGNPLASHTYRLNVIFDDASGADTGTLVQLAGVQIGLVKSVKLVSEKPGQLLKNKAELHLEIKDRYVIPAGSTFTIATPILGTTGVVTVVPPADASSRPNDIIKPGTTLRGMRPADLTAAMEHATVLLDQLTETTKKANQLIEAATGIIGDPRLKARMQNTVANLDLASANGGKLMARLNSALDQDNAQVLALISQTQGSSRIALRNITDTTADVRDTMHQNKAKINDIVGNLQDTSAALAGITSQTNDFLKNGGIRENMTASLANLKTITDKLNGVLTNVEKLTSDQGVQSDLKATLHNVRESTEETTTLLERLNKLTGAKRKPAAAVVIAPGGVGAVVVVPPSATAAPSRSNGNRNANPSVQSPRASESQNPAPLILPRVNLQQNTRASAFRMDVDAIAPVGVSGLGRVGVYGFGDSNKLTVQFGKTLAGTGIDLRGGLYASKLSVGADFGLGKPVSLSLDFWDVNNSHLDARGVLMLNKQLGIVAGADDITRHSGPVIGLEFRN